MINIRSERANTLRFRGDSSQPRPGAIAQQVPTDFAEDPPLYRHGKKTLKRVRALIQERHGLQRSVTSVVSPRLAVDELAALADAADSSGDA